MIGRPTSEVRGIPSIIIFTDLDGTLLDRETYGWGAAKPALKLCHRHNIPIIPVSSKTRAEIEIFQDKLGLSAPFISENGGGIFFPRSSHPEGPPGAMPTENHWKWSLGPSYDALVKALG